MEKTTNAFEAIKTQAEEYLDNRITLVKLQIAEKGSKLFATLFTGFVIVILAFCVIIFLSIMAGDWFAVLLGSQFKGFAVIGGIYILALLFVLTTGRRLVSSFLINKIIKLFFDKTGHQKNHPNEKNG